MKMLYQPINRDHKVLTCSTLVKRLITLATMRGTNPNKLLKGTKIFESDLNNGFAKISADEIFTIIDNIKSVNHHHELSFLAGRHLLTNMNEKHPKTIIGSNNLSNVIRFVNTKYLSLMPLISLKIMRHARQVNLLITPTFGTTNSQLIFLCELVAAMIFDVVKSTLNTSPAMSYFFPYELPNTIEQYHAHLGKRCYFGQHMFLVSFSQAYLSNNASTKYLSIERNTPMQTQTSQPIGIIHYINQYLSINPHHSLEELANHLENSSATLKRKLKHNHTTFQQIQDEKNAQIAIYHLLIKGDKNTEIANQLQFTDINNFRRSFKRWTGTTPSEYKKCHAC